MYSNFWKRLLANFIDGIVIYWLISVALDSFLTIHTVVYDFLISLNFDIEFKRLEFGFISRSVFVFNLMFGWLYFTLMESSKWQATLGKMALGIVVVDELYDTRISFGKANKRYWSKMISSLIIFIGYIMVFFTQERQALHDKIAGTHVVDKEKHHAFLAARAQKIDSNIANKVG
ncbi:RDD family protein [compost metagenome]